MRTWRVKAKGYRTVSPAACCGICAFFMLAGGVCGKAALRLVEPELLTQITVGTPAKCTALLRQLWPQLASALLGLSSIGSCLTPLLAAGNGFLLTYRLGAVSAAEAGIPNAVAARTAGFAFLFCLAAAASFRMSALLRRDAGRFWRRETLLPYGLLQGALILAGAASCFLIGFSA